MSNTLAAARALYEAGLSVVAVAHDGSKRPRGEWKEFQTRRANPQELIQWFGGGYPAIGVVTGTISGNLEMAEIEGRAVHQIADIAALAETSGLAALWDKVNTGWVERSPSGGIHWFYRLPYPPAKNTKLATRPATAEELEVNPKEKRKVLTETRGEGGFVVTAPSNGTTHESGKAWEITVGGPATVPTLTAEEHEQFHALLASINEEPPEPAPAPRGPATAVTSGIFGAVSPGDDFEAKTDWADILVPEGWRFAFQAGHTRFWTRPGKSHGISATTGKDPERDRLFVFTSASDFPQEEPITKFGAYAIIHHAGDHSAAASALRKSGYGQDMQISLGPAGGSPFAAGSNVTPISAAPSAGAHSDWTTTGAGAGLATVTDLTPAPASTIAHTDDGNAALLISHHGKELRYNPDRGRWLWWTGNLWEWQHADGGQARELAKDAIRSMPVDGSDATRAWKKKSLSAGAITSMLQQAATDQRLRVAAGDLDANGWELNTPAGIIDLRTATLRAPDPTSLHTKITAASPDFEGTSPLWEKFLTDTFPDADLRDYVQRLVGYSAVGVVREHILPFGLGEGGNGKGAMFETLKAVLGDYATTAPAGFLMKSRFQNHPTDVAALHGARMVLNSEVNEDDRFDEAKVKQLAGGDSVTARFMRQDNFTFKPTHQMWLFGNYQPGVEAGGKSFWRRLRLIPFLHTVPDDEKIEGLAERLAQQHGGAVLAWIARGAAEYYREGLREPESVKTATADYQRQVDTVGRFLEDECLTGDDPTYLTGVNQLRNAYTRYCDGKGERPVRGRSFEQQLEKHGIEAAEQHIRDTAGQRLYTGVRLRSAAYRPQDDRPPQEYDNYQQPAPGF